MTEFLAKPISAKGLHRCILNVVANPRPFIQTASYFGPDRRRNVNSNYGGPERRNGGHADVFSSSRCSTKPRRQPELAKRNMAKAPIQDAVVATFADHQLIVPANMLKIAVVPDSADGLDDAVARAESALAELASEFATWMEEECHRLDEMRRKVRRLGFTGRTRDELFRAAHDIKGEAATFGFPQAEKVADSLCA